MINKKTAQNIRVMEELAQEYYDKFISTTSSRSCMDDFHDFRKWNMSACEAERTVLLMLGYEVM